MTLKHYSGSCHCKSVRYEVDLDLAKGTMRCNCSICTKSRAWFAFVNAPQFKMVSGEESLLDYQCAHLWHGRCAFYGWQDVCHRRCHVG
jgi:hypothetical protein